MAEEPDEIEEEEGADAEGEQPSKRRSGRFLILIAVGAIVLVAGGLGTAWFTGLLDPIAAMLMGTEVAVEAEEEAPSPESIVFLDLPEILVNLNTGGRKPTFLKIRVALEMPNADDVAYVETMMRRVLDTLNVYLRELRIEDLKGSAGMYRLREELLKRVRVAVAPAKINDVLFKEMLVQ